MKLKEYLKGRTQRHFAAKVGISEVHLHRILKGTRRPSRRLVNRIIQETDGEVGHKELRPDIYKDIMGAMGRAQR
jgi:DNA-binding transcriptional regulator YdaS (Cro superfamily)